MPIFNALGADCTVLDYSALQIESELIVATREGYTIKTVQYDMTKPLPFDNEEFDIIFHPVSNCYVEEVEGIFKECYRILKKGGILVCGLDNGMNFITNDEITIDNELPFNPLKNPKQMEELNKGDNGIQFSHTLEEQIGGQLKAGFILTDLYEDTNGEGRLHELHIPSFLATRAIKKSLK
jgi:SAM-dependent methyltransferase